MGSTFGIESLHRAFSGARRRIVALALASLVLAAGSSAQDTGDEVAVFDGKSWSLVTGDGPAPWAEADAFCETLEAGSLSDWRLPTLAELESLRDPAAPDGLPAPLALDDCCAWSAESLSDIPAGQKGQLPDPAGPPEGYFWGFLFASGVSYYSNGRFPDGTAVCISDTVP